MASGLPRRYEEAADHARSALEGAITSTVVAPTTKSLRPPRRFRLPTFVFPVATAAIAMLALTIAQRPDALSFMQVAGSGITVVDGDTIRVNGRLTRLVGFNAPETWQPACAAERTLGEKAKARLRELVAGGSLGFSNVRCSCKPGTEGTEACNYGRACGTLKANGRDVGDILRSEGLAVQYTCGATWCPPKPVPWCA